MIKRLKKTLSNDSLRTRFSGKHLVQAAALIAFIFVIGLCIIISRYDTVVRAKFEGKRWAIPAQVYARPLELFVGQDISQQTVLSELKRLQYRAISHTQRLKAGQFRVGKTGIFLARRGFQFWDTLEPTLPVHIEWNEQNAQKVMSITHIDNAEAVPVLRLDPPKIGGIYPSHGEDRVLASLEQVPPTLVGALIAIEDQRFYEHAGISWRGILRAAWVNLSSGQLQQGGSTLTQQLVKNFYLTAERTFSRKLREVIMARLLEFHYEKDEILETYLNEVYLGQASNRAIHGFGLASQFYFGQPINELAPHQSALLVALVKGASFYDPRRNPERAKKRRDLVLNEMLNAKVINDNEHSDAIAEGLGVVQTPSYNTQYYPAYINLVNRQLRQDYRDEDLQSEGLRLFTSLDPSIQHAAETALKNHLNRLEHNFPKQLKGIEGGVVVVSLQHGEVLAAVGGRQLRYTGFNRALDAKRPIGSLVKPAVFLAALESRRYSLASLISDDPITITLENGREWSPQNFDHESHGETPLITALVNSYNQATVRLGMDLGVENVMGVLNRLGLAEPPSAMPSRLLGSLEASPLAMATVYQTIANNGFSNPSKAIRAVLTAEGEPLTRYGLDINQVFDEADIKQLQYAMMRVMSEGTGQSHQRYISDFSAAGKTGTSDEQRDAWFVGISRDYVIAVWVGFDDNRPTPLTGSSGALPIWADMMKRLDAAPFEFEPTPQLSMSWLDPNEQALSDEACEGSLHVPIRTEQLPEMISRCATQFDKNKDVVDRVKKGVKGWFKKLF